MGLTWQLSIPPDSSPAQSIFAVIIPAYQSKPLQISEGIIYTSASCNIRALSPVREHKICQSQTTFATLSLTLPCTFLFCFWALLCPQARKHSDACLTLRMWVGAVNSTRLILCLKLSSQTRRYITRREGLFYTSAFLTEEACMMIVFNLTFPRSQEGCQHIWS